MRQLHHSIKSLSPLLLAALLAACSKPAPVAEPLRAVRVLTVATSGAVASHEYPTEVRARTESRLGFRVGGKLVNRKANLGDSVRAGQVLAQIDPADLRLGQDAARAAVVAATANLEQNEAEIKRYRELRDQGFISGMELDRRESALKAARAQAEQARAQAGVQANQAAYSTLVADVSGVVTGVDAEPGAVLAAGTPVLRIAQDGPRDAVFTIPEDRIALLRALLGKPGAVRLKPWGVDDKGGMPATVREVSASADPATRTFQVKADIGKADLRLGQTASVLIDTPVAAGIVKLPLSAVLEQGGRTVVWVLDTTAMTVSPQPIAVGGAEGNLVIVAGGLTAGQVVVSAGVHVLTPGQKVRLYQEPGSAAVATAVTPNPAPTPAAASAAPRN